MRTRIVICRNQNDAINQWQRFKTKYPTFFDGARKTDLYLKSSFLDTEFYFKSSTLVHVAYGFKANEMIVDEFADLLLAGCHLLDFSNKKDNNEKINDEDYGSKLFEFVEENLK